MSDSCHHDCSTKAVFLCTAIKLQSCHIDGPWASLGRILALACATTEKHWCPVSRVYLCLFPWESFSRHTLFISMCGKTEQISLVRNKDAIRYRLNSDCCMTILLRQLWEELLPWERTRWNWSKHVKFRPSWLFHKGCLSLHSCQTAMLPHWCWHIEHTLPSPPFNQHSFEQWFSLFYEVLSFEKSPWASLGRILALACATTEKHWCPVSTFVCFRGRAFLGIPYSSPCVAKLNKSVWSETRMLSAIG